MTAQTELRLINTIQHLPRVGEVLDLLANRQRKLNSRRAENTTLALEHELFMIEANKCNQILKELK